MKHDLPARPPIRRPRCLAAVAGLAGCLLAASSAAQHEHHAPPSSPAEPLAKAAALSPNFPDVEVTTQDGKQVHFYSDLVRGRVVAMNFIFTTCTTICPPMGAIFSRLQAELADRSLPDVRLISVSVDPITDTPERLKAWSEGFGAGPGWTLVTGSKPEVDRLLKSLEVFTADYKDHAPMLLVGSDSAGYWRRAYGMASPVRLAELLERVSGLRAGEEP